MKFIQNYKFPRIFRCFQQNSHCQSAENCRTLKIAQNMSNRYKLKSHKNTAHTSLYFLKFLKKFEWGSCWWRGGGSFNPPLPPPKVEIGLKNMKYDWIKSNKRNAWYVTVAMVKVIEEWVFI